jgi:hypothetical protein
MHKTKTIVSFAFFLCCLHTYQISCQEKLNKRIVRAVKKQDIDKVVMLLDQGADPDTTKKSQTLLFQATQLRNKNIIQAF